MIPALSEQSFTLTYLIRAQRAGCTQVSMGSTMDNEPRSKLLREMLLQGLHSVSTCTRVELSARRSPT